jgi:hypothetical protein
VSRQTSLDYIHVGEPVDWSATRGACLWAFQFGPHAYPARNRSLIRRGCADYMRLGTADRRAHANLFAFLYRVALGTRTAEQPG